MAIRYRAVGFVFGGFGFGSGECDLLFGEFLVVCGGGELRNCEEGGEESKE